MKHIPGLASIISWYKRQTPRRKTLIFIAAFSAPIILYSLPFLATGTNLAPGDADFLMQTEEATRLSILKYGQFPWWNPWISAGVPLFANPQFGLFSLPTLFSLLLGSIIGYKVAIVAYLLISAAGLYLLFSRVFHTPKTTAILLGYIWSFSGYFAYRVAGHFTFFTAALFPLLLFFLLYSKKMRHAWIWLGLSLALLLNSATHYSVIMSLVAFAAFSCVAIINKFKLLRRPPFIHLTLHVGTIALLAKSSILAIILSAPKLYYSLSYISQYPRDHALFSEEPIGFAKAVFAIFGPIRQYANTPHTYPWSWMEVSTYIGFATAIVVILSIIGLTVNKTMTSRKYSSVPPLAIAILGILFFSLGLGIFMGPLSPFALLSHLPVFSNMRIATRWLAWSALMIILLIGAYHGAKHRKAINLLLLVSVTELFIFGSPFMARDYIIPAKTTTTVQNETITQRRLYETQRLGIPYDENLTISTRENVGQVIVGDPLVDTRFNPPFGIGTTKCGIEDGNCEYILSKNAVVAQWTPNYIKLRRTASGPIKINMNPGKYWLINGRYAFPTMRVAEPNQDFIVTDTSEEIILRVQPKFSPEWIIWKMTGRP